jgi:hypothetical protein
MMMTRERAMTLLRGEEVCRRADRWSAAGFAGQAENVLRLTEPEDLPDAELVAGLKDRLWSLHQRLRRAWGARFERNKSSRGWDDDPSELEEEVGRLEEILAALK